MVTEYLYFTEVDRWRFNRLPDDFYLDCTSAVQSGHCFSMFWYKKHLLSEVYVLVLGERGLHLNTSSKCSLKRCFLKQLKRQHVGNRVTCSISLHYCTVRPEINLEKSPPTDILWTLVVQHTVLISPTFPLFYKSLARSC